MNDTASPHGSPRRPSLRSFLPSKGDGRLLRRTFLIAFCLMSAGLFTSGVIELIFRYRESVASIQALQQEMAHSAAFKIQQFVEHLTDTLRTVSQTSAIMTDGITESYRFQLLKLLHASPAMTNVIAVDATGHEQLKVSRVHLVHPDDVVDRSADVAFRTAQAGTPFFGPVYFVRQSEPYMRIAVPIASFVDEVIGVLIAEVNLKYIWDVAARITAGQTGYAYVVSRDGDLIAHPDMSLVLQKQNLTHLDQVHAALSGGPGPLTPHNLRGETVFTASAIIPDLGWAVFVERMADEAYAPLYASLLRIVLLLVLGLGMAGVASVLIGRRVLRPLEHLRQGALQIGAGALHHRIDVHTGDELQTLADTFNHMASRLQASYADLEAQVAARTRELAQTVEDLEIASQHKSQFLANMSHELRTPLHAIMGYTELILDNAYVNDPAKLSEALTDVQHNADHLLKLINDVLDISRIEAGRFVLSLAEYSLQEVVQTAVITVDNLAAQKQLALTVAVPSDLPVGRGDAQRLTQVLINLVGNAIHYTASGEIGIEVSASDGTFAMAVTDTGPGIAPEDQQRIFESFEQVRTTTTRSQGGTGLGLAICKNIIERHGGCIGVTSRLGEGSTFWCTFPVRVEQ